MTTTDTDAATIQTAEEFARELEVTTRRRAHALQQQELNNQHGRALALIWAPVVALIILGFAALLAFIVHAVTTEHTREHELDHLHKVTVWCYADSNVDSATSSYTGSPADVRGICPDAR